MIRPEAAAALLRFRDLLIGAAVTALGLFWILFSNGALLPWIGYPVALTGAALIFTGLQRLRFEQGRDGPGTVQIVEGRIVYFGPLSGGVADLESLTALSLDPTATPAHWLLAQPGQPPVAIPVTADGADALFDAFAHLPGLRTGPMLRLLEQGGDAPVVIWRKGSARDTLPRLH